jgi:hypothetical protein
MLLQYQWARLDAIARPTLAPELSKTNVSALVLGG